MATKDDLGRAGEQVAVDYLRSRDHRILDRNWRCADGEIDAVTLAGDTLVIVEVKTRSTIAFGHPLEAVNAVKLARLWRLAREWVVAHPRVAHARAVRVDLVGLTGTIADGFEISHLEDVR